MNSLQLQIGGLAFLLRSRHLPLEGLASAYRSFVVQTQTRADLVIDVDPLPPDRTLPDGAGAEKSWVILERYFQRMLSHQPDAQERLGNYPQAVGELLSNAAFVECLQDYDPSHGKWQLFGASWTGAWFLDRKAAHARVFLSNQYPGSISALIGAHFYVVLRAVLVKRDGMLFHAAGVVNGDGAHVFLGSSGSGKTTMAWAAKDMGWSVLADDGLIVRRLAPGEFRAFRTPWNMKHAPWNGSFGKRPESAPIRSFSVVRIGSEDFRGRLDHAAMVMGLVQSAFLALRDVENRDVAEAVEMMTELSYQVLGFNLHVSTPHRLLEAIANE